MNFGECAQFRVLLEIQVTKTMFQCDGFRLCRTPKLRRTCW